MKTTGMKHQIAALQQMWGRAGFGLFMEQGTGKTWTLLADAERHYAAGLIDGLLVIAPKGVHTNWIRREIPTHVDVPHLITRAWRASMGKRAKADMEKLLAPRQDGEPVPLRVLSMNIDAVMTKDGYDFARRFLLATNAMFAIDESSRIKNGEAGRSKKIMELRPLARYRRILSGTPITNAPVDVFNQMEFLESGLLGTTSARAFTAEYAELLRPDHPMMLNLIRQNPRAAHAQVVARNPDGSPRWRNLEKLKRLLAPHTFRVLKRDCLDLPEKIYKVHPFEMTPKQQAAYDLLQEEKRVVIDEEQIEVNDLAALVKLQQITSGYVIPPGGGDPVYMADPNPRLQALMSVLEDIEGKVIIWARFREELRAAGELLRLAGYNVVEYHGGVNTADREAAVDNFQNGKANVFLGQPQSGGIGLTLTAAETVIYISNDFNLETRLQSEDRAHRIGTKRNVVYIDLIAEGTIDEGIARSLTRKSKLAGKILGDDRPARRQAAPQLDIAAAPGPVGMADAMAAFEETLLSGESTR